MDELTRHEWVIIDGMDEWLNKINGMVELTGWMNG